LRDVRLAEFVQPRDEFVQQAASMFVELVRMASPPAFFELGDMTRDEALAYLAAGDEHVKGAGRARSGDLRMVLDKHRSFDDTRPLDLDSLYPEAE
jgi:hypothetical protein